MEINYTQQEILLMTDTTFAAGHLYKNDDHLPKHLTEKERLEEACWNGFIQMMLPEIHLHAANGSILYLWEIKEASSFLELDLGEVPAPINRQFSIDPYSFLSVQAFN